MDSEYHNTHYTEPPSVPEGPYAHYRQTPLPKPDNSPALENAALIMGICSLIFLTSGLFFFFAGLGILFALLSRGSGHIQGRARVGLALSLAAFLLGAITIGSGLLLLSSNKGDNSFREQFETYYEAYMNGEDVK